MKNYTKQLPNSRAVAVVLSWLRACNIAYTVDKDNNILVQGVHGPVKVNLHTDNNVAPDAFNVPATAILDTDIPAAIKTFQKITEVAGYGTPSPVDRGDAPTKKLNYKKTDEFELVAFRHREFRAAPNPNDAEILKYKKIYESFAHNFYKKNMQLCGLMGYTAEDISTYCKVWTVNFLHKYAIHNPSYDDNEKLLVCHLKQRLPELASLLRRKAPNIGGCPEYLALVGEESPDVEGPDESWRERNQKIFNKSYASRRKEAKALLEDSLSKLPHDQMVGLLRDAAENRKIEFDARKEATKRLTTHTEACDLCRVAKVEEKTAG